MPIQRPSQRTKVASKSGSNSKGKSLTLAQARILTQKQPHDARGWKALGTILRDNNPQEAFDALTHALALEPNDYETMVLLAVVEQNTGHEKPAVELLRRAIQINPQYAESYKQMAKFLYHRGENKSALEHIQIADDLQSGDRETLSTKANILARLYRQQEAILIFDELTKRYPGEIAYWNNIANAKRDIGKLEEADIYYQKAIKLAGKKDSTPFSNRLTAAHYRPDYDRADILSICNEWQKRFAPAHRPIRPNPEDKSKVKSIRIGMFSDGFRKHPVGMMITSILENIEKQEIELYAYSTNNACDEWTRRIQSTVTQWMGIQHLTDEEYANQIKKDKIDILIDLCGHNSGSRMGTVTMEPAPIIVKWVGGLINTTGVEAIDYLLTDCIESPVGEDAYYVEKLIRMPDDYICYAPPPYTPKVAPLPALNNGYITLGSFNNPTKVNEIVLSEWAEIMHELPNSRLFLKGNQYNNDFLCQQIRTFMAEHGINSTRTIIEGHSDHKSLLESYNRVDIALDTWPYSGGLTTCEAMLMGVPVVTLPGPTFAGRHSATHLVNTNMPELVVGDWKEYRQCVVSLASNLESLSTIREHLQNILLQSAVCDAGRFATHFTTAMRAIWQRYCEGKPPAALSIDKQGDAWLEGDSEPMEILHPAKDSTKSTSGFSFSFKGKVVTVDSGPLLAGNPQFYSLQKLDVFSTIVFDPTSKIVNTQRLQHQSELHYLPHIALGDGQPTTLYACIDPNMSATIEPMPIEQQLPAYGQTTKVITKIPISTQSLDGIEGLQRIDWLLLDNMSDALKVLEHGKAAIADTLVIQIRINFVPSHYRQSELTPISTWLSKHGFSFYRLNNLHHDNHLPKCDVPTEQQPTQLVWADAIFLPDKKRMAELSNNQRLKLAFLLHTVYGIRDLTHHLINAVNPEMALAYGVELEPTQHTVEPGSITDQPDDSDHGNYRYIQPECPAPEKLPSSLVSENIEKRKLLSLSKKNVISVKNKYCQGVSTQICVGVAIRNEEKYITETINSLKAQAVDNVRFLITDNCSTDSTLEICRDLTHDDRRFFIVEQETNIGAAENFRFAFNTSNSKYFMWLGGHDYISNGYLKAATKLLDQRPDVSMVCGQPHAVLNSLVKGVVKEAIYDFSDKSPLTRYLQSVELLNNCTIFNSLFRKEAIDNLEWRSTISMDHVLISHLLWQGQLHYMKNENYYRRYFKLRTSTQSERISGDKGYLSRYDFYNYYLDDFSRLYTGEERMKRHLEGKIIGLLERRFGNQGLLPNDGLLRKF